MKSKSVLSNFKSTLQRKKADVEWHLIRSTLSSINISNISKLNLLNLCTYDVCYHSYSLRSKVAYNAKYVNNALQLHSFQCDVYRCEGSDPATTVTIKKPVSLGVEKSTVTLTE